MKLQIGVAANVGKLNTGSATANGAATSSSASAIDEEEKKANFGVMGVQRGPVKATRQALIKKDDSQRSLQGSLANSKQLHGV